MKATCRTFLVDNTRLWIKIELASINTVAITVSIPCRNGQYVILECEFVLCNPLYRDYNRKSNIRQINIKPFI